MTPTERARIENCLKTALSLAGRTERLMLSDPAQSRASAACDMLTEMQTTLIEMNQDGLLSFMQALEISEPILKVLEEIISRRESEVSRSTRQ